ncbi:hypothetical protein GYH30_022266 [Glycine max]|uniref:Methyltransferase type 11 domain-containing protein n=2 Tax=Glycine subgen. Soja TaxID=1462606 RepID=A0A0R0IX67_SOYBN|nr:hypothetical protein GYH30_022266 [Glycine max]RZB98609.1 (S)-coclaurine N-methyltransferase [Glycine soja]
MAAFRKALPENQPDAYTNCRVTRICNSMTQKAYIDEKCRDLQLQNLNIIVADISTFEMEASYDRIFSIEMFEHMKNYKDPLKKISKWMKKDGLYLFITFATKHLPTSLRITRYFFTGGTMPSTNLLFFISKINQRMAYIKPIMQPTYGKDSPTKWTAYWRTSFIAVAELFGYNNGELNHFFDVMLP